MTWLAVFLSVAALALAWWAVMDARDARERAGAAEAALQRHIEGVHFAMTSEERNRLVLDTRFRRN